MQVSVEGPWADEDLPECGRMRGLRRLKGLCSPSQCACGKDRTKAFGPLRGRGRLGSSLAH
ncbi:hypothetical protein GCM10010524_07630 [Streptomyces mexicanus]